MIGTSFILWICTLRLLNSFSPSANCHRECSRSMQMGTGNVFGKLFRISTFGESHGKGVGVIVDGCPPRIPISVEDIQRELNRRF